MNRGLSRLFRLRLALLNGAAAVGGSVLYPLPFESGLMAGVFVGITLLAAGGSALNQVLERGVDRLMNRTRLRPVAQGSLSPCGATIIGVAAVFAGTLLLARAGGFLPAALGVAGIAWYLAVYTPLKRRTPFALISGAVCGALPPLIGWCSCGGSMGDYRILMVTGLLYLWQIPHFWLFQRRHADDYRAAGFPLLAAPYRSNRLFSMFGLWVIALIAAAMLLPALGLVAHAAAVWCTILTVPLFVLLLTRSERTLFVYLNTFPLLLSLTFILR